MGGQSDSEARKKAAKKKNQKKKKKGSDSGPPPTPANVNISVGSKFSNSFHSKFRHCFYNIELFT